MPSRVFVVQQPAYFSREKREFVAKYDLSPASIHGKLIYLLGPGNIFKNRIEQATRQIRDVMAQHDFAEDDFILAIGDPVAIAAAAMIAGNRTNGRIRILKWDRITNGYEPFDVGV